MSELQEDTEAAHSSENAVALSEAELAALKLVEEMCSRSGQAMEANVVSAQGEYLTIALVGEDVPATWGRSGQALDALQMLLNAILHRHNPSEVRIMLDADNYRQRRRELLQNYALQIADEVKQRNEECELEPLPAHERRIIHTALADDPAISTYSEGNEPARRVVIAPRQ